MFDIYIYIFPNYEKKLPGSRQQQSCLIPDTSYLTIIILATLVSAVTKYYFLRVATGKGNTKVSMFIRVLSH